MRAHLVILAILSLLSPYAQGDSPVITPDAAIMRLDELGLYTLGFAYRGQPEQVFPAGWSGDFDDQTGVSYRPAGDQGGKAAVVLHPPWRGGTGRAFQQLTFKLPAVKRITLRGFTALRTDVAVPGKSDGVTFRVFLNDKPLLDTHRADASWQPFEFDLSPQAGSTVTLRFETDPGPRNNSSFDFALWADRELVLEGYQPPASQALAPPPLDLGSLSAPAPSVIPPVAAQPAIQVVREADAYIFNSTSADGQLSYRWSRPTAIGDPLLGRFVLTARMAGAKAVVVPLATSAAISWSGKSLAGGSHWDEKAQTPTLIREFSVEGRPVSLRITASVVNKSLALEVACDTPVIRDFDPGAWGPTLRRRPIPVPFYSGQVFYLAAENLFVNTFLDWKASSATSHQGTRARYEALTDGTRLPLAERAVFSPSWYLPEVLPGIPNPPSPFREQVGGRLVIDVWGGSYQRIEDDLKTLADHGVKEGIVLIHNWQRDGYDNALPAHYPAAADKGGEPAMKSLVATGKRLGHLMALHENYVDYYPNYEHFNEREISLNSAGERQKAWYNPSTGIQSFAVAPDAILQLAASQSPEIQKRYATTACFLDVHSAVPPWFHVDQRATAEGAGRFAFVFDTHRQLWQYERVNHNGPVLGEGNNHWFWSGLLDGAEAQYGAGWPNNQGRQAPLAVDFDLLRIHPLQVNHGMGYHQRWWSDADEELWGPSPPMVAFDQYRLQTLAYGHAPFLSRDWNNVRLAWLEQNLSVPVATRYALARPLAIDYLVNYEWVDATSAAKAGDNSRVRIQYDNGLTLVANQATESLTVGNQTLPCFGWLATSSGFQAGTTLRDGVVTDFVDAGDQLFASARPARDWEGSGIRRIQPTVSSFDSPAPRRLRFTYQWQVDDSLDRDFVAYVHFGAPGAGQNRGEILFQQDHRPAQPTSAWKPGTQVVDGPFTLELPADLPDGRYAWTIGLYSPQGGERPRLLGAQDRAGRIVLGILKVASQGRQIDFEPADLPSQDRALLHLVNLNPTSKLIDFGPIQTDGSVALKRDGTDWVLRPWPTDRAFTIRLDKTRFPQPASIRSPGGASEEVTPTQTGASWTLPLNSANHYRWPAHP